MSNNKYINSIIIIILVIISVAQRHGYAIAWRHIRMAWRFANRHTKTRLYGSMGKHVGTTVHTVCWQHQQQQQQQAGMSISSSREELAVCITLTY